MKILLKFSIVFIALSFFYFFNPVNKSSQNFLSLSEAEKIEKNIYNDFKITPSQIKKAITYKTKMIIYRSPCNPSVSVYSKG